MAGRGGPGRKPAGIRPTRLWLLLLVELRLTVQALQWSAKVIVYFVAACLLLFLAWTVNGTYGDGAGLAALLVAGWLILAMIWRWRHG